MNRATELGHIAAIALVLVAGCSGKDSAGGKAGAESGRLSGAAAGDVADATREIWRDGFYRAPGATATLTLPELSKSRWQVDLTDANGMRQLELIMGPKQQPYAVIRLLFPPPSPNSVDARALASQVAAGMAKKQPHLKPLGEVRPLEHPGGQAAAIALAAMGRDGKQLTFGIIAVTEGKAAAISVHRGNQAILSGSEVRRVLDAIHGSLRVGANVRQLPAHDPGTALEGVYLDDHRGQDFRVYCFDRRGFYHWSLPGSELDVDFTARHQWNPARMGTYTVAGDAVTFTSMTGASKKPGKFARDETGISVDGDRYLRLDGGHASGWKLDGRWERFVFHQSAGAIDDFTFTAQKVYYFSKDGRFSFKSFADARTAPAAGAPPPSGAGGMLGVPVGVEMFSQQPSTAGTYAIAGDRLQLTFDNGAHLTLSFYPQRSRHTGDFRDQLLYIGGSQFLKDD